MAFCLPYYYGVLVGNILVHFLQFTIKLWRTKEGCWELASFFLNWTSSTSCWCCCSLLYQDGVFYNQQVGSVLSTVVSRCGIAGQQTGSILFTQSGCVCWYLVDYSNSHLYSLLQYPITVCRELRYACDGNCIIVKGIVFGLINVQ